MECVKVWKDVLVTQQIIKPF
jgi:hypothetical protein